MPFLVQLLLQEPDSKFYSGKRKKVCLCFSRLQEMFYRSLFQLRFLFNQKLNISPCPWYWVQDRLSRFFQYPHLYHLLRHLRRSLLRFELPYLLQLKYRSLQNFQNLLDLFLGLDYQELGGSLPYLGFRYLFYYLKLGLFKNIYRTLGHWDQALEPHKFLSPILYLLDLYHLVKGFWRVRLH